VPSDNDIGRVGRVGLALVRPRWALAIADDPGEPGRAGTDLVIVLIVAIAALATRELVGSAWLAQAIDLGLGARALLGVIAGAVTQPLAFLLVGGAITFGLAGPRRALGRDFDLACVAVVPFVVVEIAATLVVRALGVSVPAVASWAIAAVGFAWSGALLALAVAQARRRRPGQGGEARGHLPEDARRLGVRAGAGAAVLAAALLAVNIGWVVGHLEWLRPMQSGDPVPAFALPRIEAGGAPGAAVTSAELEGQVVVLDFWATWCQPCLHAMPHLSALAERGAGKLVVLSVNLDDPAKARALFDAKGYRSQLVGDPGDVADRFGVGTIPHLVVVDRDGLVRRVARGGGDLAEVIALAEHLAGIESHGP